MKASKKQQLRLERRIKSFKDKTGFTKPGSQNRHKAHPKGSR